MSQLTSRSSLRKPVHYVEPIEPQAFNHIEPRQAQPHYRSFTDTEHQQSTASSLFLKPRGVGVSSAAEQLERVRRLTVDDASLVLAMSHAANSSGKSDTGAEFGPKKRRHRFGFSFSQYRARSLRTTDSPLAAFKIAASKLFHKLNPMKPRHMPPLTTTTTATTATLLTIPSHSYNAGSLKNTEFRLSRHPSISSFTSVATAPEYMLSTHRKPVASLQETVAHAAEFSHLPRSIPSNKTMGPRVADISCSSMQIRSLQRGHLEPLDRRRRGHYKPLPVPPILPGVESAGMSFSVSDPCGKTATLSDMTLNEQHTDTLTVSMEESEQATTDAFAQSRNEAIISDAEVSAFVDVTVGTSECQTIAPASVEEVAAAVGCEGERGSSVHSTLKEGSTLQESEEDVNAEKVMIATEEDAALECNEIGLQRQSACTLETIPYESLEDGINAELAQYTQEENHAESSLKEDSQEPEQVNWTQTLIPGTESELTLALRGMVSALDEEEEDATSKGRNESFEQLLNLDLSSLSIKAEPLQNPESVTEVSEVIETPETASAKNQDLESTETVYARDQNSGKAGQNGLKSRFHELRARFNHQPASSNVAVKIGKRPPPPPPPFAG
ncbi:hypothetical protein BJ741DRAFT_703959 [Chytriomyces cf. hyalinus JEL632]|nr:hypothetical protein BJ741DRAFT_703959 [Chytriomyces cf. hyalinus JEL632]